MYLPVPLVPGRAACPSLPHACSYPFALQFGREEAAKKIQGGRDGREAKRFLAGLGTSTAGIFAYFFFCYC